MGYVACMYDPHNETRRLFPIENVILLDTQGLTAICVYDCLLGYKIRNDSS